MRLIGKKAVITGSSSGIGRATALMFAQEGADVVINGRDQKKIDGVVGEVQALGRRALGVRADVSRFSEVSAMMQQALAEFGRVDVLVSNAGIFESRPFPEMAEEEWDTVMSVDLKGAFNCTRSIISEMIRQRSGRVICITATSGLTGYPNIAHIAAAKAGVHGLVKALARELAPIGITVNAIAPGLINTPILAHVSEEEKQFFVRQTPVGRMGKPEEIAAACTYLASDEAAFVTGQIINISGGGVI